MHVQRYATPRDPPSALLQRNLADDRQLTEQQRQKLNITSTQVQITFFQRLKAIQTVENNLRRQEMVLSMHWDNQIPGDGNYMIWRSWIEIPMPGLQYAQGFYGISFDLDLKIMPMLWNYLKPASCTTCRVLLPLINSLTMRFRYQG